VKQSRASEENSGISALVRGNSIGRIRESLPQQCALASLARSPQETALPLGQVKVQGTGKHTIEKGPFNNIGRPPAEVVAELRNQFVPLPQHPQHFVHRKEGILAPWQWRGVEGVFAHGLCYVLAGGAC